MYMSSVKRGLDKSAVTSTLGSVFTNSSQEHSLSFFSKICKLECSTTSDFGQSDVVLHPNASKYRKKIGE